MGNPYQTTGLLSSKCLFRPIKMGQLSLADVRLNLHPREYTALVKYTDRLNEQRYPFVIALSPIQSILTSQHPLLCARAIAARRHLDRTGRYSI